MASQTVTAPGQVLDVDLGTLLQADDAETPRREFIARMEQVREAELDAQNSSEQVRIF